MIRVLLVDDERAFARAARRILESRESAAAILMEDCRSARAALNRLATRRYHVVIIDWVLADADGLVLGRKVREMCGDASAVIMLTGRRIGPGCERAALEVGFDDFIVKPCSADVLRARVVAAARRVQPRGSRRSKDPPATTTRSVAIDVLPHEPAALVFSNRIRLGLIEWKILGALCARRGDVVVRGVLLEEGWGASPPADPRHALDKHVSRIRAKLGAKARAHVETVRGAGYRLTARDSNAAK